MEAKEKAHSPATMVSVLPVGGLLVKSGSLDPQDFVTVPWARSLVR